jgi:hypothetical protein
MAPVGGLDPHNPAVHAWFEDWTVSDELLALVEQQQEELPYRTGNREADMVAMVWADAFHVFREHVLGRE